MAKDSLSALLDGECSASELDRMLEEIERSPDLKVSWSRLCLARDSAEGVRVRREQPCICADVMRRLDAQPASATDRVVPLFRPRLQGYWKPLAGLAAAASVAALAVSLSFGDRGAGTLPAPGLVPQAATPVSAPLTQRPRYLQTVSTSPDNARRAAFEEELRAYLIEHSNTLADRGMGGTLSYARFAAHTLGEPVELSATVESPGEKP
ncbi:MAG: sigma-E factor negative regulatory protein [Gammaproteobacteria bacterium]